MIGGGIIYIDDKARGLHEGYLLTPISKSELILGFNLSGAIKASLAGLVLTTLGSIIAGIPHPLDPVRMMKLLLLIAITSIALISMMFLFMVRVSDPLVPRAIFGVLNTLLFFPSGAVYPINGFPKWMKVICQCRSLHLRRARIQGPVAQEYPLVAIAGDLTYLALFAVLSMLLATWLFPAHALTLTVGPG